MEASLTFTMTDFALPLIHSITEGKSECEKANTEGSSREQFLITVTTSLLDLQIIAPLKEETIPIKYFIPYT